VSKRVPRPQSVLGEWWPEALVLDVSSLDDDALDARWTALAAEGVRSLVLTGIGRRPLRGLGALRSLRDLHLVDSELDRLPPELGELRGLRRLKLETFGLLSLPRSIGALRGLLELHVDSHRLSHLPDEVFELSELRSFGLVLRDHYECHDWDHALDYFAKAAFRQTPAALLRALAGLPRLQTLLLGEPPSTMWDLRCPPKVLDDLPPDLALLEPLETLILAECPPGLAPRRDVRDAQPPADLRAQHEAAAEALAEGPRESRERAALHAVARRRGGCGSRSP
jgi:Leucine-rich repeat (LRR) protein